MASDNFTGTGALSANWTLIDPSSDNYRMLSDSAVPNALGLDGGNWWNADTFGADQFSEVTLVSPVGTGAGVGFGVILRASGAAGSGTFYRIVANADSTNNIEVGRRVGGAYTFIATRQSASAFVNGDVLRAEVQGTTIRVYRNGTQCGADITDANISSGQPGIGYSSTMTSGGVDSWSGAELTAASVQRLAPSADSNDGTWTDNAAGTALAAAIDELTPSDTDYIQSVDEPQNSGCRVKLATGTDPASSTGHVIHWRIRKDAAGGSVMQMSVSVRQGGGGSLGGGTLIASRTRDDVGGSGWTTYDETLTGTEADLITDYADLYMEFFADVP